MGTHLTLVIGACVDAGEITMLEGAVASRIVNAKTGVLLASKPPIAFTIGVGSYGQKVRCHDYSDGCAAYIWRMVAFAVSKNPKHHCMPTCADFDVPREGRSHEEQREIIKRLDYVADCIVNRIPKSEWYGVHRWAQAYGMTGTPRIDETDKVIYR